MLMLLLFALLFNATFAVFVANSAVNRAQAFASDDAVLICTGHAYKWISLKAFNHDGSLEFIESPEGAPATPHGIKCVFGYLTDSGNDRVITSSSPFSLLTAKA
ncbi:hypothetical protein GPLA_4357 [Paraglaciecola polaris LMG 21857]|uniref:Uncharacterized protein n=2 Tax=Paraglaciecola polaris TaxID=222814 RepID=K6ZGU6_9ALTE|nr:hypothetical protein GPLA_4357 [Paraglaciecola polaris LMG 21857]|tara:strand:- start:9023 stop:9334 length:312 start_codon:yes stop_codon:yes gene_type:complete